MTAVDNDAAEEGTLGLCLVFHVGHRWERLGAQGRMKILSAALD